MSEPEVTSGMIAAGVKVIAEEYGVLGPYEAEGLARDVFVAMMKIKAAPLRDESIAQLTELQQRCERKAPHGYVNLEPIHEEADAVLTNLLDALGYEDVVAEWEKVEKWYA